jgi:uncharacterized membrane protein
MPLESHHWASAWEAFSFSLGFMTWNSFLALIPLGVSLWIFRAHQGVRHLGWWLGLAVFVAFLPNAPYVLTDIIHLVLAIREGAPMWIVVLVLMPQYFVFMLLGFEAYVLSLINLGHYLSQQGYRRWVVWAEFALHGLCALGIYLGRFPRFNSWDLLTNPRRLISFMAHDIARPWPILVILITAVVIAAFYWPLKQVSLAIALYARSHPLFANPRRTQG